MRALLSQVIDFAPRRSRAIPADILRSACRRVSRRRRGEGVAAPRYGQLAPLLAVACMAACPSGDSIERARARAITDHFDTGQQIADEVVPGVDDPDTDGDAFVCARDVPARFAAIATAPAPAQR